MILDTSIRFCIFLPTLLMAFLAGYLMRNIKYLTRDEKEDKLEEIEINQAVKRSKLLLENGHLISAQSFAMRKHFLNDKQIGFFCSKKFKTSNKNETLPVSDLKTMVKNNIIDLFPMISIAGLNNWMFSGFIATRLPFPVTLRFKPMLQRDIDMPQLDASWVSSISWYFMSIMGFRYLNASMLGNEDMGVYIEDDLITSKDEIKKAWEDIEIYKHHWSLENSDFNE